MAGTCPALLEPGRFVAAELRACVVAFAARDGAARAAEAAMLFFRGAGSGGVADDFLAEGVALASLTLLVGSVELLPVAFFPPVVFAICHSVLAESWVKTPEKNKNKPLETFYYSTRGKIPPCALPYKPSWRFISARV
jgi:hypothetical protein